MNSLTLLDLSGPLAKLHCALDKNELATASGSLIERVVGPVRWQILVVETGSDVSRPYVGGIGGSIDSRKLRKPAPAKSTRIDLLFRDERVGELVLYDTELAGEEVRSALGTHIGSALVKLQLWVQEEKEAGDRRLGSEMLGDISSIVGSFDIDFVLARLLEQVMKMVGSDVGSVMLWNGKVFDHPIVMGLPVEVTDAVKMDGKPAAEAVAEAAEPLLLEDPELKDVPGDPMNVNLSKLLILPLSYRDRIVGVLQVANPRFARADSPYMEIAEQLCSLAAVSVENATLHATAVRRERLAAMGQIMAGLSHDIRNMLHAMQAGMYLLESGVEKSDMRRIKESYPILGSAMDRVSSLVLDMLDFSMNRPPRREPMNPNDLVNDITTANSQLAESKQIRIESNLDPEMQAIPADSTGIFRCMSNLLTNALEALPDGGTVAIETEWRGDEPAVWIRVSDDGPGISAADQKRLFDALFTTKGTKGTGLGLAVTKKIVDEHGGKIRVDSKPGNGATFTILLPKEVGRPLR